MPNATKCTILVEECHCHFSEKRRFQCLLACDSASAFTIFQQTQFAGVAIWWFWAVFTTAPQIASTSVGAPRNTSCSMDEWFEAVLRATSSAALMGSAKGKEIFSASATRAVSLARVFIISWAEGSSNSFPFATRRSAVNGLIA